MNLELLVSVFELTPHWVLQAARSGAEAIAMVKRCRPDVILMDMHLGDMNGIELAVRLKRLPTCAAIPVIGLSADAMSNAVESANDAGLCAYLTKPVNLDELFACIDAALLPIKQAEPAPISVFGMC